MYCISCGKEIPDKSAFCPICGKPQGEKPTSNWEKIKIYTISFIFMPFGLWWFFKYFRSKEKEKRIVGYAALIITIISLIISSFTIKLYLDKMMQYIQDSSNSYINLGL